MEAIRNQLKIDRPDEGLFERDKLFLEELNSVEEKIKVKKEMGNNYSRPNSRVLA